MALSLVATLHSALVTACRARGCESCRWFMLPTWQDPPKRVPTCWCGDAHRPGMHALLGGERPHCHHLGSTLVTLACPQVGQTGSAEMLPWWWGSCGSWTGPTLGLLCCQTQSITRAAGVQGWRPGCPWGQAGQWGPSTPSHGETAGVGGSALGLQPLKHMESQAPGGFGALPFCLCWLLCPHHCVDRKPKHSCALLCPGFHSHTHTGKSW